MKELLLTVSILLSVLTSHAQNNDKNERPFKLPNEISTKDYIPGIVIVKLKADAITSKTFSANQFKTLRSAAVLSVSKKFPDVSTPVSETFRLGKKDNTGLNRIYELKFSGSSDIEVVINDLLKDPSVEYAEPSYIHHINYIPNDPRYTTGQQAYLDLIKAPQAWNVIRNASGVIIGIVDSGSELAHQDLAANIYHNTADPINGVDDDHDGYTDNFSGWDLVGASGTNIQPDNDPNVKSSANDHGVHVSGIAAAVTDNGIGVASVSFNCAKLLIVKAGPDDNGTDILRGYEGIKYAADHGATIINCSWGSEGGGDFGQDVVNYAIGKGCLIIAAAGNEGTNKPQYPAAYRGVLAIANTLLSDVKASSSNYGAYVSLSAPGTSIMSTVFNNQYAAYTGTSMSSPVVASAAALVKSAYPALNMQQVGELLRVTADDIDVKNPTYIGQLGKGRLNVYRALTESPPSVRIQKIIDSEKRAATAQIADTLYLYIDVKNFLFPVNNLQLTLSSSNPLIAVLQPQKTIASLSTLETASSVGPFKVIVPAGTASNTQVDFRMDYAANNNSYRDFETFTVIVARDYINISSNSINTTASSNGRIGFSAASAENGVGFLYKGEQLLYEASLMIGKSPSMVSNNTRSTSGSYDEDFVKQVRAHEIINNTDSVKTQSEFDDAASSSPLNVYVKQTMLLYKKSPDDKYAIAEYEVFNRNNSPLRGIYVGLFTDWDIEGGSANITQYDASQRLGYVSNKSQQGKFGAVKLLSENAAPAYYPLSYNITGNPLSDDDLTIAEKWETLSSGIKANSLGTTTTSGIDVSFVSGNGPYDIPANSSVRIAFALIGGDNLQDLQASAQRSQTAYDLIEAARPQIFVKEYSLKNYPNPVIGSVNLNNTVQFSLPEDASITLEMYNTLGQKVRTLFKDQSYKKGVYERTFNFSDPAFSTINSGFYYYRLIYSNGTRTSGVSVLK